MDTDREQTAFFGPISQHPGHLLIAVLSSSIVVYCLYCVDRLVFLDVVLFFWVYGFKFGYIRFARDRGMHLIGLFAVNCLFFTVSSPKLTRSSAMFCRMTPREPPDYYGSKSLKV